MLRRLLAVLSVLSLLFCVLTVVLWSRAKSVGPDELFFATRGGKLRWVESGWDGMTLTTVAGWPNPERPQWIADPAGHALLPGLVRRGTAAWATDWSALGITYRSGTAFIPLRVDGSACRSSEKDTGYLPTEHGFVHLSPPVAWWGITMPHGGALALFAVMPLVWMGSRVRRVVRPVQRGLCPSCRYDLRATPDRCPECGRRVGEAEPKGRGRIRTDE